MNAHRPHWTRALRIRLITMLTVALVPLGLLAVLQTASVVEDAADLGARDILSRTARAAGGQEALLRDAYGAAQGLGAVAVELGPDTASCAAAMARYVAGRHRVVFAGFIGIDGRMACSSDTAANGVLAQDNWRDLLGERVPRATFTVSTATPEGAAIMAAVPLRDPETGALLGVQAVAVTSVLGEGLQGADHDGVALALVNREGAVLAAGSANSGGPDLAVFDALGVRPDGLSIPGEGMFFTPETATGATHIVAVVPLIDNRLFAVGLWPSSGSPLSPPLFGTMTPALPVLMWAVSLVVAYLAVSRLVLRPLSQLRRQMQGFSLDHGADRCAIPDDAPAEIRAIAASFNALTDRILADRDALEHSIGEKELLLREVHHRVKNNLQLISSILNMNIRGVHDPDAKRVLKRVQDRVMSLSTIHKALYTGTQLRDVRVDLLLSDIVNGMIGIGLGNARSVRTEVDLAPVTLDPDQAVPLCLLVAEAVTNALKYIGKPEKSEATITVRLRQEAEGRCTVEICNTLGAALAGQDATAGTGLGSRLIEAFTSQLDGSLVVEDTDTQYRLRASFTKLPVSEPDEGTAGPGDPEVQASAA